MRSIVAISVIVGVVSACGGSEGSSLPPAEPVARPADPNAATTVVPGELTLPVFEGSFEAQLLETPTPSPFTLATGVATPTLSPLVYTSSGLTEPMEFARVLAQVFGVEVASESSTPDALSTSIEGVGGATLQLIGSPELGGALFFQRNGPLGTPCTTTPTGDCAPIDPSPAAGNVDETLAAFWELIGVDEADLVWLDRRNELGGLLTEVVFAPGGVTSEHGWVVLEDGGGGLLSLSGPTSVPAPVGSVDLVDLDEALGRINALYPEWSSALGERSVSQIQSVLVWLEGAASVWLVPAYRFVLDDGNEVDVPAIDARHLAIVPSDALGDPLADPSPPPTVDEPILPSVLPPTTFPVASDLPPPTTLPGPNCTATTFTPTTVPAPTTTTTSTTLSPASPPTRGTLPVRPSDNLVCGDVPAWYPDAISRALVGVDLDAAIVSLESMGYTVRVLEPGQPMTADYNIDRVNLTVENGLVVNATLG